MENVTVNQLITSYKLDKPKIKDYFSQRRESKTKCENALSGLGPIIEEFITKNLSTKECQNLRFSAKFFENVENQNSFKEDAIINIQKINNIRYLNKYFELINLKLKDKGKFIGCVQNYTNRKEKIKKKYPKLLAQVLSIVDFLFNRIAPKLPYVKKLYFSLTKGRIRVLSRAETFGRLYSCGFEVIDHTMFEGLNYFIAQKKSNPSFDFNPTYGPIISLKRVGKNKQLFKVYKVRTMHPYSEYLQEYVYGLNKLQDGGKFKDDFRISPIGRVLRKFWIDEIPMILNIIKGDMKLVGVRPLSQHYFSLYSKELQDLRTEVKPGFIPPFYADNPKTLHEIMESEKRYLLAYRENPFTTDLNYLVKSLNNVLFKGFRSF